MFRTLRPLAAALALAAASAGFVACGGAKYEEGLYAEVQTNKGLIVLRLEFEKTPMTVASFVGLAEGTIANAAFPSGKPYFNGTKWHRVVAGHVIQCGVPAGGAAQDPGYRFPNEIVLPDLNHGRAGMVNMANSGPHTNASQWCITLGDRSYLDGDYTVFGQVVKGLDVVFAIAQGDEIEKIKIVRVGQAAKAFKPTTESFQAMVEAAKARVAAAEAEKKGLEEEAIKASWPKAIDSGDGIRVQVLREGKGQPLEAGTKVRIAYAGRTLLGDKSFVSTADGGRPFWGQKPEPFEMTIGAPAVNGGFDAQVARMRPGERRLIIVPGDQGYKTSGYYARERQGERRFVISPNTALIYTVDCLGVVPPEK